MLIDVILAGVIVFLFYVVNKGAEAVGARTDSQ